VDLRDFLGVAISHRYTIVWSHGVLRHYLGGHLTRVSRMVVV
jgi:hypothetical protein